MQRSWESGTGGLKPGTEMVGGVFLSRPKPYMGCSAWKSVSRYGVELRVVCPQTGQTTLSSTPYRQLENQSTNYDRQQPLV